MSTVRRFSDKVLMASLVLAIIFSVPASAQNADPSVMANLVIQVQELQDEVRNLRGQLEDQSRELENLKRRQRDQYLDPKLGGIAQPLRAALTGSNASPGIFEVMEVLRRDECLGRLADIADGPNT